MQDVHEQDEVLFRHGELALAVNSAGPGSPRWDALQAFYRGVWKEVRALPPHRWAFDPNLIDWQRFFSPIEAAMWGEIRAEGAVLYPQHPVGGYFVDFGHPVARIAIECDGKQFHQDRDKDAERQAFIESKGWRVYRLSGANCFRMRRNFYDEDGCEVDNEAPATELVRDLAARFKLSARYAKEAA